MCVCINVWARPSKILPTCVRVEVSERQKYELVFLWINDKLINAGKLDARMQMHMCASGIRFVHFRLRWKYFWSP